MNLISRYFESWRKRRAIRCYARRLPRLLAKDYGYSKTYTPQQIRKTIERSGMNTDYSCYGVAMFSGREDFNEYHREIDEYYDYDAMRRHVAEWYFDGNADFTISDISAAFYDDGADGGLGGDSGSGDGGGGGHSGGGSSN
jgi:hypothetical protein